MSEHHAEHLPAMLAVIQAVKHKLSSEQVEPFLILVGIMLTILAAAAGVAKWYVQDIRSDFSIEVDRVRTELSSAITTESRTTLATANAHSDLARADRFGQSDFDNAMSRRDALMTETEQRLRILETTSAVEANAMLIYRKWVENQSERTLETMASTNKLRSGFEKMRTEHIKMSDHLDEVANKQDNVRERLPEIERSIDTLQKEQSYQRNRDFGNKR